MPKTISVERIKSFHPDHYSWNILKSAYPNSESVTWRQIYNSNGYAALLWVALRVLEQELDTELIQNPIDDIRHAFLHSAEDAVYNRPANARAAMYRMPDDASERELMVKNLIDFMESYDEQNN